jgi:hypothetical protein
MVTRRHVLALAGSLSVAGCLTGGGQDDSPGTDTPDTVTSTPTPEDTPTETEEPTETPEEDLTGEELYFNWVHGGIYDGEEHEEILEEVQGTGPESISFNEINDALEQGGTRVEQVANAVETAAHQYGDGDNHEDRHRHIMSAVHQTLEQKDEDFDVYSIADDAKSNEFVDEGFGLEYGKIWVENEEGEYDNINLSLDPEYTATHIEGEEAETKVEEALRELNDVEYEGDRPAHDYEALSHDIEVLEAIEGELSDERLEEIHAAHVEKFDNYTLGDGISVPSSTEEWRQFHEGMEAGPDMMLGLTQTYHREEYEGEPAKFTVEDEVDGSVSMGDTPEGYDPSVDGIIDDPAA